MLIYTLKITSKYTSVVVYVLYNAQHVLLIMD